ncbi:hypothetical protein TNCV_4418821 [Trichonephila clavipes]|nr:hypothetical protein TNCV_4418821 [Trichonephila clavipes]
MWASNYGALGQTARVCFGVGQVCSDVDKELWRLGPDGSEDREERERAERKRTRESGRENERKEEERRKRERGDGKRRKESWGERESDARLEWKKGLSPEIGVKKTMNAGGGEIARYEMFSWCEKCWIQVSPVPASDEVCPPDFWNCML